ncbi:MAG: hypothetical protein WBC92_02165, partial [Terracidiphilus sp.]
MMLLRNALIVAFAFLGAIAAQADVVNLQCVQTGPTKYRITYELTGDTRFVRILASTEANQIPSSAPLT